jgi:hypothetical protein
MKRPNIALHPIQFFKYVKDLEAKNERYETTMKHRLARQQFKNGMSISNLIEELEIHEKVVGSSAPVSIEFVTGKTVEYRSIFDVGSNIDGVVVSNWARDYE